MRVLLLFLLITVVATGAEVPRAFWVWHRDQPLTTSDASQLRSNGGCTLYWHVGMATVKNGQWAGEGDWLAPEKSPALPGVRCVPVLRGMMAGVKQLPADSHSLVRLAKRAMERWQADEVQLDFDCPDRLLPAYAAQLKLCRDAIRPARLSITALAGWAHLPVFEDLSGSVDLIAPMFYDLELDQPNNVLQATLIPLIAQRDITRHLDAWSRCRTPWLAGLPCFARLSLFDAEGRSGGHIREWLWDEAIFLGSLKAVPCTGPGIAVFDVTADCQLHDTPLTQGQRLVARTVDVAEAAACASAAMKAGASGLAWFRMPTSSAPSGWSLSQAVTLAPQPPTLRLVQVENTLRLENTGPADLPPRFAAATESSRGWQIELEETARQAVFREAAPGQFARVSAHVNPDAADEREAALSEAQRLTFWLGDLKAGATRQSGLFSTAPGTDPRSLRWRLRGGSSISAWQPLAAAPP